MVITRCKVNHLTGPLGYRMSRPVFSYVVEGAAGKRQTEARILVSLHGDMDAPLLDTGFSSEIDSLAYEADIVLKPRTRYYWTVTVRSDAGEEAVSPVNRFETGKRGEPWVGQWITCDSDEPRHPVFSKEIAVKRPVSSARLYICGLGLYEAYLNGGKIGEERLTPYCNNYRSWLQYQTYDVTGRLGNGGTLSVLLGNGWYKGRFTYESKPDSKPVYGDRWKLIAELRIVYDDGSEDVIGTNGSWSVTRSDITFSNIYDGEIADAALPDSAPVPAMLCDEPAAPLSERLSPPVTVREELPVIEVIRTPAGETVLDVGQIITGIFRLRVHIPKGGTVRLWFGEVMQKGCFYRENLRTAKAEYIWTSDGKEHILEPRFTFYGYRYVKVEGIPGLKAEDFTGLALYSEIPDAGTLITGHELVNKLISNTRWGLKGNFLDVPTDCPQRDERMGWTGDAQVFTPTACFLTDCAAFFKKYLYDMATEQERQGGLVPNFIPSFDMPGCSSVWGDAACIMPWYLYEFYGDMIILAEQYESMRSWVEYTGSVDGDDQNWRAVYHYGDWLALDNPKGGADQVKGGTDDGFIADVYYMNSANILSKTARLLSKDDDAEKYAALADTIRARILDRYYDGTGLCNIDTQTALLLTLRHNLADIELTKKRLTDKFKATGGKLQTGFVGTPLLCNVLSEHGLHELAYSLLLNEEYPGWLYEVKLGATTVWERWNSIQSDGSISSTGMNSLNHYAYGSIVEWVWRCCAGINPCADPPGFRRVRLSPVPDARLRRLEAEYRSPAGTYKVMWDIIDGNKVDLSVVIPFGCEADLAFPLSDEPPRKLEAGEYRFLYNIAEGSG